jgi:hypothetical protein
MGGKKGGERSDGGLRVAVLVCLINDYKVSGMKMHCI